MIVMQVPEVVAYAERRLNVKFAQPYIGIGFMTDDKRPLCAVVLNDFADKNCEVSIVAEPGGLTRGVLRFLAVYIFEQLQRNRVTVRTRKRHKAIGALAKRIGFTFECLAKGWYPDDDAVVFRMLKAECPWRIDDESKQSAAAA